MQEKQTPAKSTELFTLEKACIFLFELAISFEFLIAPFYWGLLFDGSYSSTFEMIDDILGHGTPLLALLIEFGFNIIPFYMKHLALVALIQVVYLIVNVIVSLVDKPVYGILNWKDLTSYLVFFGVLVY